MFMLLCVLETTCKNMDGELARTAALKTQF